MQKYRHKDTVVEAFQLKINNDKSMQILTDFLPKDRARAMFYHIAIKTRKTKDLDDRSDYALLIRTPQGDRQASDGDYIVRSQEGEFCIVKKDRFRESYEKI